MVAMSKQRVIALVGMPGSGKGTCTDYLEKKHGWPVIHFGNMVYEEVQRRGLDNVKDEIFVREDMRQKEGPAVLAKHVAKKVVSYFENGMSTVVLDGLYSWTENKYLAEKFGESLVVIAIVAPKKLRRDRVLNRKDSHRKYTLEKLINREIAEIENIEKGGPIAYADYTILNDSDTNALTQKLDQIIDSLN
jgi:dephospho-CoA kinase